MKIALGTVFILVTVIGLACWAFATLHRQYRLYGRNWPWQTAAPPIENDLDLLHACGENNGRWVLLEGQSSGSTSESRFKCDGCGDCAIGTPPADILKLVASINESLLSEFHKSQAAEIMKLAKFGAMVMASKILMYHDSETITDAFSCELLVDDTLQGDTIHGVSYAPNIEATIKELLND